MGWVLVIGTDHFGSFAGLLSFSICGYLIKTKMKIKVTFLDELLSDFGHERFSEIKPMLPGALAQLAMPLYGQIGHPSDDCSVDEFLSQPHGEDRAFSITALKWAKWPSSKLLGDIQFMDSPVGQEAKNILLRGGRFSIRSGFDGNTLKIVTWDLIPPNK